MAQAQFINIEALHSVLKRNDEMLDITKFKAKNDCRLWMNSLFNLDGYIAACDGHKLVVDQHSKGKHFGFPKYEDLVNQKMKGRYQTFLKQAMLEPELFEWHTPPTITEDMYKECTNCNKNGYVTKRGTGCFECGGSGEVELENDYNTYDVECKSCDGTGDETLGGWENCEVCSGTKKHLMFVRADIPTLDLTERSWTLNAQILQEFIHLECLKVAWVSEKGMELFLFKFSGGAAIVMPMKI